MLSCLWYFYNTWLTLGICVGGEGVVEGENFVGAPDSLKKLNWTFSVKQGLDG